MDYNKMNTKNTLESLQEDGNRSNIEPDKSNEDHEEKANINNNNPEDDSKVDTDAVQIQVEQQNSKEKGNQVNLNTLDESVWETLKRDLKRILHKIEYVLLPRFSAAKGKELQNWDMWGPLLMCVTLCVILSTTSDDATNTFVIVFVIFWFGGLVITLNAQFLGAKISVLQIICLLGYCIFPINIAALIIRMVSSAKFVKVIVVGVAFIWSCLSSIGFVSGLVAQEKKMITVYPIFLFFLALSWFVLNL